MATTNPRRTVTIRDGGTTLILWLPRAASEADHAKLVRIARRHGKSCEATWGPDSALPESTIDQLAAILRD